MSKLSNKGEECKLVGYSSAQKGYRLIDKNMRVFVSRNVKFIDEHVTDGEQVDLPVEVVEERKIAEVRRNPMRSCRKDSPIVHERESRKEAEDAEEPPENQQLMEPVFKVGGELEIKEPASFKDADSGPWSKWW